MGSRVAGRFERPPVLLLQTAGPADTGSRTKHARRVPFPAMKTLGLAALILLAACSSSSKTSFTTVEQVTGKLKGTPAECTAFEPDEKPLGNASGECAAPGGRYSVVVAGTEAPKGVAELAKGTGQAVLVGPGWVLASADRNLLDAAKKELGGRFA